MLLQACDNNTSMIVSTIDDRIAPREQMSLFCFYSVH